MSSSLPTNFLTGTTVTTQQGSGIFNQSEWAQVVEALNIKTQAGIQQQQAANAGTGAVATIQAQAARDAATIQAAANTRAAELGLQGTQAQVGGQVRSAEITSGNQLAAAKAAADAQLGAAQISSANQLRAAEVSSANQLAGVQATAAANLAGMQATAAANEKAAQAAKEGAIGAASAQAAGNVQSAQATAQGNIAATEAQGKWADILAQTQNVGVRDKANIEADANRFGATTQANALRDVEAERTRGTERVAQLGIENTREQGTQQRLGIESQTAADVKKADNDLANLFAKYKNERVASSNLYAGRMV